jgi:hypothetical protein
MWNKGPIPVQQLMVKRPMADAAAPNATRSSSPPGADQARTCMLDTSAPSEPVSSPK